MKMMMTKIEEHKKLLVLVLVFFIPSGFYLLSQNIVGYDSYFFLNKICVPENGHYNLTGNVHVAQNIVLSFLPCDLFLIKLLIVALFAFSLFVFYLIGEETKKGYGWPMLLFLGITPLFTLEYFKLENETFAFPFLFLSLYCFIKYLNRKKTVFMALSIVTIIISSFFWLGSFFYILIYALMQPLILVLFIPLYVVGFNNIFMPILSNSFGILSTLAPKLGIVENSFFYGLIYSGIYVYFLRENKQHNYPYLLMFLPMALIGTLNPKYFILAVPFFALAMCWLVENTKNSSWILVMAVILNLGFAISYMPIGFVGKAPKTFEVQGVKDLIDLNRSLDKPIANDWGLGHMVWFYGGQTEMHSGPPGEGDWNMEKQVNRVTLTYNKVSKNCVLLNEYGWNPFGETLKLYDC